MGIARQRWPSVAWLVVAMALLTTGAQAQRGVVAGRVLARESRLPLEGAAATLGEPTREAISGADGRFAIVGLSAGVYRLRLRFIGYRPDERRVTIAVDGDTAFVEILLTREATVLDPVRTETRTPERALFESRPNVSTLALSARAVEAVPRLAEADIVRVVQLLPGVSARNDFSTGLNVRGGEADQNLILIDGYPIYNPFHLGALFSTFMDATVGDVQFMTAAFPARYGGRLSSVLDVRSAVEPRDGVHGTVDLSALSATGQLGGSWNSGLGSWTFAARRTYADAVVDRFSDNILPYFFHDAHAHLTTALPGGLRFAGTVYQGRDVLDADLSRVQDDSASASAGEGTVFLTWGNRVLGGTLATTLLPGRERARWRVADSVVIEQRVSRSTFNTTLDVGQGSAVVENDLADTRLATAVTLFTPAHDWSFGYEGLRLALDTRSGSAQTTVQAERRAQEGNVHALHVEDLWRLTPRVLLQVGARYENVRARAWSTWLPRASLKVFLSDDVALTAAAGRYAQWVHSLGREESPVRIFDLWIAADSLTPVTSATHVLAGIERQYSLRRSLRVEGFYKHYDRLLESNPSSDPLLAGDEFLPLTGQSYGVDILLRQAERGGGGLSGWIGYTWASSRRERNDLRYVPGHDRRHTVNVVLSWRRARYLVGARLGYASGAPFTPIVGELVRRTYDPVTGQWEGSGTPPRDVDGIGGARNTARLPPTRRLDLSLSREFLWARAVVTPFVNVVNVSNARNVSLYLFDYATSPPTRRSISQFPIIPSAGVGIAF